MSFIVNAWLERSAPQMQILSSKTGDERKPGWYDLWSKSND